MPKMHYFVLIAACCIVALDDAAFAQENFGSFRGDVIAKFLPDGRIMRLEQPYGYTDPKGRQWDVPVVTQTGGACISRARWVTYPPSTGKYRTAAVIHDHMCATKMIGWKETHEVFYSAMRAAGVGEQLAKTMYGAVYHFGT